MSDKIYNSILDTIGHTPILKLNRVVPEDVADVYVKLEFFNPGGSIKDRIALAMVEKASSQHHHRTNFRQHRDWLGGRSQRQGLPLDHHHAGNDER